MPTIPSIDLSVKVTRTSLGLSPLQLNDRNSISEGGNGYEIIRTTLGPGNVNWRRTTVSSPWVEGESTIQAVKEQGHAVLGVRCLAESLADLTDVVQQVCTAFSQYRYTMEIVIGNTPWGTWLCDQADWTFGEGGSYNEFHFRSIMQEIRFDIPRLPTPSAGAV